MDSPLILRADGGPSIGAGHVMRSLALGQAWEDAGGRAILVAHELPAFFDQRANDERIPSIPLAAKPGSADDARVTAGIARELRATWVVVDGYHFTPAYSAALRDQGLSILVIDDEGLHDHGSARIILNQNLHADRAMYASEVPGRQILLGPRYALLRREFWPWRGRLRASQDSAHELLLSMGGTAPRSVIATLLGALEPLAATGLRVVLVAAREGDVQATEGPRQDWIRVEFGGSRMPELMSQATVAISAAGSTCWELAYMGLPALVVSIAPNQLPVASSLGAAGVMIDLGWHENLDPAKVRHETSALLRSEAMRGLFSERGRALVDGDGGRRVVMAMRNA